MQAKIGGDGSDLRKIRVRDGNITTLREAGIACRNLIPRNRLAEDYDIENAVAIIDQIMQSVRQWNNHSAARGIPRATADMVADQHRYFI